MKIAFYIGKKRLFNRLTSWWTKAPESHVELVFDDERSLKVLRKELDIRDSWAESPRGGIVDLSANVSIGSSFADKGVRMKNIDYTKHPERWYFIEIPKSYVNYDEVVQRAVECLGMGYDVLGLAGFVYGPSKDDRKKLFCSEFIAYVFGMIEPWRISPAMLRVFVKWGVK